VPSRSRTSHRGVGERGGRGFSPFSPFLLLHPPSSSPPPLTAAHLLFFAPPPLRPPPGSFNLWNGFKVEQSSGGGDGGSSTTGNVTAWKEEQRCDEEDGDWASHPSVLKLLDFHRRLLGSEATTKYVLDWLAQMYQFPAKKIGTALLLNGGGDDFGKSRFTDLHREIMGSDKLLQTAKLGNGMYGRFNRQREGRLLIVINESNGKDNHVANDVIKDMITCDEFQSEGKGTNSYTMSCYARFIFTTNNENCLRVNPGSRRYVVIEVSSTLRGGTDYARQLSALIDDTASRYAFYRYLMERDISGVDWINDRPVTDRWSNAIAMNLPYEHQFLKHEALRVYAEEGLRGRVDSPVTKMPVDAMYDAFNAWLQDNRIRYETTRIKFGLKMTKLVRNEERRTGFSGFKKSRQMHGVVYWLDPRMLVSEMRQQRWLTEDEV
jgi:Family of unknown function (DUF5906)